ncbi:MAG: type II toxin-antitoxin system RelE/ParE family toxin [Candidatus Igneacidithiobacillus chanchocoensis]
MAEFRLTPAALQDLEDIWRYSMQQWGIAQAERYVDALHARLSDLASAPFSAPSCDSIRPGYRQLRAEHHVAYYMIQSETVVVIRILHERMDVHRHI